MFSLNFLIHSSFCCQDEKEGMILNCGNNFFLFFSPPVNIESRYFRLQYIFGYEIVEESSLKK